MGNEKKIKLAVSTVFSLVCVYFLFLNFSKFGCIATVFSVILLFALVLLPANEKNKGLIGSSGNVIGVIIFNFIMVSLFNFGVDLSNLLRALDNSDTVVLVFIVLTLFVFSKASFIADIFDSFGGKAFHSFLKYVLLCVAAFFGISHNIGIDKVMLVYILVAYVATFLLLECAYKITLERESATQFFTWALIDMTVLYLATGYAPAAEVWAFIEKLTNLQDNNWKWYSCAVAVLLMFGFCLYSYIFSDYLPGMIDRTICLAVALDYVSIAYFVKNSLLMGILLAIINVVFIINCSFSMNYDRKKLENPDGIISPKSIVLKIERKEKLIFLGVVFLLDLLWYAYLCDKLFPAIIVAAAVICGIIMFRIRSAKDGIGFWIYAIAAMSLISFVLVKDNANIQSRVLLIINVAVIATIATFVLNQKNRITKHGEVGSKAIVSVCTFLILLFSVVL